MLLHKVLSKDLIKGDLVYYEKGDKFAVDAVILATSYDDGSCFVDTAELDGETNLKRRTGPFELNSFKTVEHIKTLKGEIQSELPNQNLISFEGRLVLSDDVKLNSPESHHVIPLNINNLLLRGAVLRNTEYCWGLVLYTGKNTKIMKNLKKASLKISSLDNKLNRYTLYAFIYNLFLLISSVLLELKTYYSIKDEYNNELWYLGQPQDSFSTQLKSDILSYFAVYTYVIPISLFVSIEVSKLCQGLFMHWDKKMTFHRPLPDGTTLKQCMRPNNTNINEDLGMVEYIFSDKTGTLTQNQMVLSKFFINGLEFHEMKQLGSLKEALNSGKTVDGIPIDDLTMEYSILFLRVLSLAHDVLPTLDNNGGYVYESSSPDETALLNSAAHNGFILSNKVKIYTEIRTTFKYANNNQLLGADVGNAIKLQDFNEERFEQLFLLEFNSDRKRMSVIVKNPNGKIHLYSKGADNIMLSRLSKDEKLNPPSLLKEADKALTKFSEEGLRTLVLAWRELTEEEFLEFKVEFEEAERSLDGREEKIATVAAKVEIELRFLGCTAIEDKLQDEVPETIDYLLKCGIKIWLLTGDKQETAINIGLSSKLLSNSMNIHILKGSSFDEVYHNLNIIENSMKNTEANDIQHALVVQGETLGIIFDVNFKSEERIKFLNIGKNCKSVICCRVTPLQKASVVHLVKKNVKCITLAIGDGANDVSMIQSANIGVGIMGREGTQAVRASDYAFAEFRFLRRLVCVHGRFSYMRISSIIMFGFYKNCAMITVMWWFGFYSQWSGTLVFEEIFMSAFNIVYVSLPPLVMAIFDRDVNEDKILRYPQLYIEVSKSKAFWNLWTVLSWLLSALYHSAAIFWCVYLVNIDGNISETGRTTGYWAQTAFLGTPVLTTVLLKFCLTTKTFNYLHALSLIFSMALNSISIVILEYFGYSEIGNGIIVDVSVTYYLICILMPVVCCLPDFIVISFKRIFLPHDADVMREESRLDSQ
ncbi:hypothetical protein HK099_000819, partial [Clydaea vesicula]